MSNYTKFVNFAAKDDLLPNDPDKVIKGSEFDAEFVAIQAAINSKANTISPALTGAPTVPTAALGDNSTKIANTAFVVREINSAVAAGTEGLDGASYLTVSVWIRSATPPATPTGGSFNFTGLILTPPAGWSSSVPNGTDPVYISTALASTVGTTGLDDSLSWSAPVLAFQNGADGSGTDTISANGYLYYSNASSSAPVAPTNADTNTYVFSTNTFSVIKAGWSTQFSAPSMSSGAKFWAVQYYVEEDEVGTQTVTIGSTPFTWLNFDGLVTFSNFQSTFDSGVTVIDGGKIATGTLSASKITTGTLSGNLIDGGAITGVSVYATGTGSAAALYGDGGSNFGGYFTSSQGSTAGAATAIGFGSCNGLKGENNGVAGGYVGTSDGYSFYTYAGTTGSAPFTGAHEALLPLDTEYELGDIVVDVSCVSRTGWSDAIFECVPTTYANQKAVIGVLVKNNGLLANDEIVAAFGVTFDKNDNVILANSAEYEAAKNNYNIVAINALGEGQINVCGEGGNIEAGDLIVASNLKGKGMKQADDIIRGYTVAKARESVTFTSANEVKQIACIYVAG
jgi:hypothetical protein